MTLEQALQETLKGNKVKLPEWTGYWFREDGQLKVFCKDGSIADTPHFDKYETRSDWEVTEGNMGFDFALLAMENGKRVRRGSWNPGDYLKLLDGKGFYFIEVNTMFGTRSWHVKHTDILAKDWEVKDA